MIDYCAYIKKWETIKLNISPDEYFALNEKSIIDRINVAGMSIQSVWKNLLNPNPENSRKMLSIVNILLNELDNETLHPRIMSGIVRSIGNKDISKKQNCYDDFSKRYLMVPPSSEIKIPLCRGLDQSFSWTLSQHFTMEKFASIIELLDDEKLGESRGLLLIALKKYRNETIVQNELRRLYENPLYKKEIENILK
jgi:hypothetical protein